MGIIFVWSRCLGRTCVRGLKSIFVRSGCGWGDSWAVISSRLVFLAIKGFIKLALAVTTEESLLCIPTFVVAELLVATEPSRL